ncbi:MAG: hypothetical protein ACOX4P_05205 [Anaerovoracaceae bacterium]|jgi:predicted house-cleaning noncanonical NTP pyrophosphatase (MazG superfamily)
MKRTYNKLIRDKIPELIEKSGRKYTSRVLNDQEYHEALIDKIIEEIGEYRETGNEEEIADIYEALDCLVRFKNYEPMRIDYLKLIRRETTGSFNDRIFLIDVEDTNRT